MIQSKEIQYKENVQFPSVLDNALFGTRMYSGTSIMRIMKTDTKNVRVFQR